MLRSARLVQLSVRTYDESVGQESESTCQKKAEADSQQKETHSIQVGTCLRPATKDKACQHENQTGRGQNDGKAKLAARDRLRFCQLLTSAFSCLVSLLAHGHSSVIRGHRLAIWDS